MRRWSQEEDTYLRANYWTLGTIGCSSYLGRPPKGIGARAELLGIKGQRHGRPRTFNLTPEQEREILHRHKQGEQQQNIAPLIGVPIHVVKRTLRAYGIQPKPNRSLLLATEIGKDYMELKLNGPQLCAKYAMSSSQIYRVIKAQGLNNPERGSFFRGDINAKRRGRTNHQMWTERYGKEEADRRDKKLRQNRSEKASGSKNSMYGRPTPQGAGNGWKGWYKEHYFRSLREASYMIELDQRGIAWSSAENLTIPYIMNGKNRTYRPDYRVENRLIEIKPLKLHTSPSVMAKRTGAEIYCAAHGLTYEIIDVIINAKAIEQAIRDGKLKFDRDYEKRFFQWVEAKPPRTPSDEIQEEHNPSPLPDCKRPLETLVP